MSIPTHITHIGLLQAICNYKVKENKLVIIREQLLIFLKYAQKHILNSMAE